MAVKTFITPNFFLFFFLCVTLLSTLPKLGIRAEDEVLFQPFEPTLQSKGEKREGLRTWKEKSARRLMIGSIAPTCTYNECRGCRFKCRAEQVPVDANDPINSAYRYRCVCHR